METIYDFNKTLSMGEIFLPGVSIDCVIFGFHDRELKVLLAKFKNVNLWTLLGGFIHVQETLEEAALHVLRERTGLTNIYLEQFHIFSSLERDDAATKRQILELSAGLPYDPNHFIMRRFLSVGYYALVDFTKATPTTDVFSELCEWCPIDNLPNLVYDHNQIIQKARETLGAQLDTKFLGFNLLPETFTMPELQSLYEMILGKKLSRRNFQRKMLNFDILERLEKRQTGKAHKAPFLYRLNLAKINGEDIE